MLSFTDECLLRAPPDLGSCVKGRYLRPHPPVQGPAVPMPSDEHITACILANSAVPDMSGSRPRWSLAFRDSPGTVPERAVAVPATGHHAQDAHVAEGVQVRPEQMAVGGQCRPEGGEPRRACQLHGEVKACRSPARNWRHGRPSWVPAWRMPETAGEVAVSALPAIRSSRSCCSLG